MEIPNIFGVKRGRITSIPSGIFKLNLSKTICGKILCLSNTKRSAVLSLSKQPKKQEKQKNIKPKSQDTVDKIVLLLFASAAAWYYYGGQALKIAVFSALSGVAADLVCACILKAVYKTEKLPSNIISACLGGWCVALASPADIPFILPVAAVFIGITIINLILPLAAKKPTIVNGYGLSPELAALTLLSVVFGKFMFSYPKPSAVVGSAPSVADSIIKLLADKNRGGLSTLGTENIIIGNVAGAAGTTCFLLMSASLLYIIIRRPKESVMPVAYMLGISVMALAVHRAGLSAGKSLLCELAGGSSLFIAAFILSEKNYQTKNIIMSAIFGLFGGVLTMLLRYTSLVGDGSAAAAMLVNIAAVIINRSAFFKKADKKVIGNKRFKFGDEQEKYLDELGALPNNDTPDALR